MPRSTRTFPELVNIKDKPTHESLRQNWQRTYDHAESITALKAQIAALESSVETLQTQVANLREQITHALTSAG